MTNLEILKALLESGEFHHATYRCFNSLWEGLWIYKKSEFLRGFEPVTAFFKADPLLKDAEELVRGTGVSVGAYGQG